MLKEVGQTGLAERAVGRADLVPDVMRHHGCPPIGHDDHLHAVVEGECLRVEHGGFSRFRGHRDRGQRHAEARGWTLGSKCDQNTSDRKPWSTLWRRWVITGDSPSVTGLPSARLALIRSVSATGSTTAPSVLGWRHL